MGTGSGALLLTLLAERPLWSGIAIDASETALAVARQNAASLDLEDRASVRAGDWTKAGWADDLGTFDLIVCNPPYVEEDAPLDRDVRDYEPASALFSGPEGLDDYRVLIPQLRKLMNREGVAILEIGATQADAVGQIAEKAGFRCSVRRDLANRPRVVSLS